MFLQLERKCFDVFVSLVFRNYSNFFFSFIFYSYFPYWCIFYLSDVTTEAVSTAASHHEGVNVTFSICIISLASQTHCVTHVPIIVLHPASYKKKATGISLY